MYIESRNSSTMLPVLSRAVMESPEKPSRNGATRELRFAHVVLTQPCERYIQTPGRHASLPAQIVETAWVLSGRDDIETLLPYLPRAKDFSDDGKVWRGAYGPRLRNWNGNGYDQLAHVAGLLKNDPFTRRAVISIYDPEIDVDPGLDIPCNDFLHFLGREDGRTLDLHVFTRSNDLMWGWSGINAFEWSALLEIVAHMVGMKVGGLHFSISSLHLYERHFKKAARLSDVSYHDMDFNKIQGLALGMDFTCVDDLDDALEAFWKAEALIRNPETRETDAAEIAIRQIPDRGFRQWARVLLFWWAGERPLNNSGIWEAYRETTVKPKVEEPVVDEERQRFLNFVTELDLLHQSKDAAYGDSWIRRGVTFSALPNICRKVDRLEGGTDTPDETQLDTAMDLLIYCVKLRVYNGTGEAHGARHCELVREELKSLQTIDYVGLPDEALISSIQMNLEGTVLSQPWATMNDHGLRAMEVLSLALAYNRWVKAREDKTGADDYRGADHE